MTRPGIRELAEKMAEQAERALGKPNRPSSGIFGLHTVLRLSRYVRRHTEIVGRIAWAAERGDNDLGVCAAGNFRPNMKRAVQFTTAIYSGRSSPKSFHGADS